MSSSLILPVEQPFIASWANQAHVFSIAQRHPSCQAWIYSHYLQIELIQGLSGHDTVINYSHHTTPEEDCPWIHVTRTTLQEIETQGAWVDFYKKTLSDGIYIYQFVNQYHIPSYPFYQLKDALHDPLVIGFDDLRQVFILLDYHRHADGGMRYGRFEVSFEELENAVRHLPANLNLPGCIELWQYRPDIPYVLDVKGVTQALSDYLNSTYTPHREPTWISTPVLEYGINIYQPLFRLLDAARTDELTRDFRLFHVLSDHKLLMLQRLKYMHELGLVHESSIKSYTDLLQEMSNVRTLLLKFGLSRRTSILDKIVSILQTVAANEKCILLGVFEELQELQLQH
ncbi:hypothetical protein [Paenibacillus kobensis]|uniref:hypothetical protein n=1 Tax=Paenibacillus kobensis TaxID=59841 RepID=UPI000FD76B27|nr:hypothetical protein [Paenibacillus kobensis]